METKKKSTTELRNKRPALLLLGLIISLSLVLTAFEWRTHDIPDIIVPTHDNEKFDATIEIPITRIKPPKPPQKQFVLIPVPEEEDVSPEIPPFAFEWNENDIIKDIVFENPLPQETTKDDPFVFAETEASFKGGNAAWSKFLIKNLKYPKLAQKMGIEGRVYVNFTVSRSGEISDIEIVRGIGGGCSEEAIRVLKKSPKWNPGLQRGRPVKTKKSFYIIFKLN